MQLEDYYYYDLYFQVQDSDISAEGNSHSEATLGARTSADDLLGELFGDPAGTADATPKQGEKPASQCKPGASSGPVARDEAGYFALSIEKTWVDMLHALAENNTNQTYFDFPAQEFGQFVHEIIEGAARLKVREKVEEAIRRASRYRNISRDKLVWKQVSLAASIINSYVDWLGYMPTGAGEAKEVEIDGKWFKLFEPVPEVKGYPELPEDQAAFDRYFYRDWLAAFLDLARSNVDFSGADFNIAENSRLGELLRSIAA